MTCKHEFSELNADGDCEYCSECGEVLRFVCEACRGEGIVEEDEYECDWVNFGSGLIVCPECKGSGWIAVKRLEERR